MISYETRREAFEEIKPKTATRRQQVRRVLEMFPGGLTAEEITHRLYSMGIIKDHDKNFVKPRLTELFKAGEIEQAAKRMSQTGRRTTVWRLKDGSV